MITEEGVSEILNKLTDRYYGNCCLRLGNIIREKPLLINIKFKEQFIPRMMEPKFHEFKKELNTSISKLIPKSACVSINKSSCSGSCHGCSSSSENIYYRIQFSEEQ